VENLADAGSPGDRDADSGKALEQFDVIQERCAEPIGSARVVGEDVVENDLQIN
jgi:hypothetical protein